MDSHSQGQQIIQCGSDVCVCVCVSPSSAKLVMCAIYVFGGVFQALVQLLARRSQALASYSKRTLLTAHHNPKYYRRGVGI